jgi:hypothetical protein
VQALFPHAPLLAPLQIESYVAVPFFDSTGTPLGLLGVMDRKPLENVQLTETLLSIFSMRIAAELERQWAEEKRIQMLAREQEARQQAEAANRLRMNFWRYSPMNCDRPSIRFWVGLGYSAAAN